MKRPFVRLGLAAWLVVSSLAMLSSGMASAQQPDDDADVSAAAVTVPSTVQYQGYVTVSGSAYDGTGYFKFAIVDAAGTTTYWSNNGTSVNGGAPTAAVPLTVAKGYFNVRLGSAMTNMNKSIGAAVFKAAGRYLRVWFATKAAGPYTQLSLTPIDSSPYALNADTLDGLDGSGYSPVSHKHWGQSWGGSGVGLSVQSNDRVGLVGVGTTSMIIAPLPLGVFGVYGEGDDVGVLGESAGTGVEGTGTNGYGVWGISTKTDGVAGEASAPWKAGVFGYHLGGAGTGGRGVFGRSDYGPGVAAYSANGVGVSAEGKDEDSFAAKKGDLELLGTHGDIFAPGILRLYSNKDVYVTLDADNDGANNSFYVLNSSDFPVFIADESGNMTASGTKNAVVATEQYGSRKLYAMESPEVWFEDVGSGQLVNGQARVSFEAIFAQTVNTLQSYHVYLTPIADMPFLLSVTDKQASGFTVKGVTMDGQAASGDFEWRVVARRLGYEGVRLEGAQVPGAAGAGHLASQLREGGR
jgi:hypothetical protein